MSRHKQNQKKLDEAVGLADLGVIDEPEFDRRWDAAGGITIDTPIEDAPDEILVAAFNAPGATDGNKAYTASLIVARGLTACGCEHCQEVEAYAERWDAFIAQSNPKGE